MQRLLHNLSASDSPLRTDRIAQVLVAIDGSCQALIACLAAVEIATHFGARVTALHVAVPRPRTALETSKEAARRAEARARAVGERVLDEARSAVGSAIPFTTELIFGEPADAICRRADELEADLVVVGSRGLGRLDRLILGSVSQAVVGRTRRSVLVVRSDEPGDALRRARGRVVDWNGV